MQAPVAVAGQEHIRIEGIDAVPLISQSAADLRYHGIAGPGLESEEELVVDGQHPGRVGRRGGIDVEHVVVEIPSYLIVKGYVVSIVAVVSGHFSDMSHRQHGAFPGTAEKQGVGQGSVYLIL